MTLALIFGAAAVAATLAAIDASGTIPIALLAWSAVVSRSARRRAEKLRRVTWSAALREGSPDARRLAALRRLAERGGA